MPTSQGHPNLPNHALRWPSRRPIHLCDNFFDSPKIQGINASSYDWWYFDAIGTDGVSSLAVVFFVEANRSGFTVTENFTNMDFIQISGAFPNGTVFSDFLFADNAIVSTIGDGSSGLWNNTGISWAGSPDLQDYVLTLDAENLGYKGSFSMHSVSMKHDLLRVQGIANRSTSTYCPTPLPLQPQTRQRLSGGTLRSWANAVPDAETTVNVTIFGSELSFVGTGYHDKPGYGR
ncbi:hypothetical protein BO85DRAFT_511463 [Aspergillus piperis CBS 112811]|uniref:Diels-Alderase N-terminal domain-containing protein n=1 Tax=Aspergillus piperis CBS 112811 TaxID=1448313 RepID=A0A8G1R5F4_9EURO|nr:hypothetical protein BO85DRAFT_511463 [Aspergillus piperis CBS 112811]RAH58996.1 hypothetical protein BO85DRAFT_511463 [Aspergillus piperis CBS 112811]